MTVTYPQRGRTLTTTRQRVNATPWASEIDARAAIMQHEATRPDDVCSMRDYTGEGIFVYVLTADDNDSRCWLAYA